MSYRHAPANRRPRLRALSHHQFMDREQYHGHPPEEPVPACGPASHSRLLRLSPQCFCLKPKFRGARRPVLRLPPGKLCRDNHPEPHTGRIFNKLYRMPLTKQLCMGSQSRSLLLPAYAGSCDRLPAVSHNRRIHESSYDLRILSPGKLHRNHRPEPCGSAIPDYLRTMPHDKPGMEACNL